MSIKSSISDELQRTPLAAISGATGVVVAALSLALAWVQFRSGSPSSPPASSGSPAPTGEVWIGNILLVLAYYLSLTIAAALLIRALARKHDIAAFFFSIPLVSLVNFSSILVLYLAPPRPLSTSLFASAHDLALYASTIIFVALCGQAVMRDLFKSNDKPVAGGVEKEASPPVGAILILGLLVLAFWCWLVFAGQTRLTRTLLPEITHQTEAKPIKNGA